MISWLKSHVKALLSHIGLHVTRSSQNPLHTLMGLKQYTIRSIVDVGANSGQFARFIRLHFPDADIYCFEPVPVAFAELSSWARTQRGVFPVQIALGAKTGTAELRVHTEHSPSSSLLDTSDLCRKLYPLTARYKTLPVRVERLDDYLASLGRSLDDDTLLKLDVQGFERAVLEGAPVTLSKACACITEISLDALYIGQSEFLEMVHRLTSAGLRYAGNLHQAYGDDGHVVSLDALFVRDPNPNT